MIGDPLFQYHKAFHGAAYQERWDDALAILQETDEAYDPFGFKIDCPEEVAIMYATSIEEDPTA
jgi:hypothetical protein